MKEVFLGYLQKGESPGPDASWLRNCSQRWFISADCRALLEQRFQRVKLLPYVQPENGVCSLWQPRLNPAAAATCVFHCVCVCVCSCSRTHTRTPVCAVTSEPCSDCVNETVMSLLGEILILSNYRSFSPPSHPLPLPSSAQQGPWTMSNNIQQRRMQINFSLHSPAKQLAAHLQDT